MEITTDSITPVHGFSPSIFNVLGLEPTSWQETFTLQLTTSFPLFLSCSHSCSLSHSISFSLSVDENMILVEHGNPLQCSCLENPRDSRAWWAAVYGVTPSRTRLTWLSRSNHIKSLRKEALKERCGHRNVHSHKKVMINVKSRQKSKWNICWTQKESLSFSFLEKTNL